MGRIVFCRGVALALARADVQQHGHVQFLGGLKMLFQLKNVVPVDGAYVVELEGLEQNARSEERLEADLALADDVHDGFTLGQAGEHARHMLLDVHDRAVGEVAAEKAGKRARILGNGHLVVVQDDDEPFAHAARLVQRFQRHAAGKGAVADDGHHMFLSASEIARRGHAEGRGNGGGGVAHAEIVIGAFVAVGEAGNAAVAAQRVEAFRAPGEQLPRVALMPHVPHDGVAGRVEAGKQRYGQFHHAEGGGQMSAVFRDHADDGVAQFLRQRQLEREGEPGDVLGKVQAGEQGRIGHGNSSRANGYG